MSLRDANGKTLEDYPRPSVAVDTALLTLDEASSELLVLQVRRDGGGWALPGTFLHPGERLADAVDRSLSEKAGVRGLRPRQLRVFDEPGRDERGWVVSVGHVAVVQFVRLDSRFVDRTRLTPVRQPGRMWIDHRDIIGRAVDDVRLRYRTEPDPDGLLGDRFTLRELRRVHEAVAGRPLQRDTFARAMTAGLEPTGEFAEGGRGRPAELFRRKGQRRPMRR